MSLDRRRAAQTLRRIAALMEVDGDNPHRVRAFANGSRAVERIEGDLGDLVASGEILSVKGIGKGIAGVLEELVRGDNPAVLEELETRVPAGVRELFAVEGLGPKKIRALWVNLDIASPGELEYACQENRLAELPGFGVKSQARVLESLRFLARTQERSLLPEAWALAEELTGLLRSADGVAAVDSAGEVRRGCETTDGVDLVVSAGGLDVVRVGLAAAGLDLQPTERGVAEAVHDSGQVCRVHVVAAGVYAAALTVASASKTHLRQLEQRAADAGMRLDHEGLWRGGSRVECHTEEEVYQALGCQWVPPELREGDGELELAAAGELPELVRLEDLRGALHNHTTASDGRSSLEEMATAAGHAGWEFLGIADHSQAAHYANGLDADRLGQQLDEIDAVNRSGRGPRLVKGLEADILSDGELDIPAGCEEHLEYVVASVHSGFRLSRDEQTARIVRAVRHPACRVLGHPTGRLLLARPGYDVDLEQVLEACADRGVTLEINASPYRLDLDWRWTRRALERGLRVAVNPDAHDVDGLDHVRWGVMVARKAGATAADVVNAGDIETWLRG